MAETGLTGIWVYLSASPLLGLTMTLLAYVAAHKLWLRFDRHPLLNPVAIAVLFLIAFLTLSDISYQAYFAGGQYVHFLLGPATVALAVPVYQQLARLKQIWLPVLLAVTAGVCTAALSAVIIAATLGASTQTQLSLAPKSVTAPVAMGISEQVGGLPSLTAVMVVLTGILGAVIGPRLFAWMRLDDDSIKGVAMGVTAHGIGTARAFQESREMGAFSGLAMALSAVLTAVLLPWLLIWL